MKHFAASWLLPFVFCLGASGSIAQSLPSPQQPSVSPPATITLPPGTKIAMDVTRAIRAATAKAGDQLYAQVSFPTVIGSRVAIPAGAYVQGTVEGVTRPTRKSGSAEIDALFTKIIFANGYTLVLPGGAYAAASAPAPADTQGESLIAIKIRVSVANDLLLDNGAQVEMTIETPLAVEASEVAQDIPLEHAPSPQQFVTATACRYIPGSPGTPGTPDTVIPGTPGTPSTTIPGGPGMPDITIPGTPATPPTVIPGTPGTPWTPGIACPPPPLVTSCTPIVPGKSSSTSQPAAAKQIAAGSE
ncbi:MAG: hypothetical protein WBA18_06465 [Terracidiphilus sp.]